MNWTILVTQNCNMDCAYCYEKQKNKSKSMSAAVLRQTANFVMREYLADPLRPVSINFCGGEPLIAFDKIRTFIEHIESSTRSHKLPPVKCELSTNATLLESEMIDYFKQHNVGYYIGFDGVKQSNDRNRRFGDSNNSAFDISLDNIRKIIGRGVNPEHIFLNLVIADNNVEYLLDDVVFISSLARGIRLSINVAYNCKWDQRSLGVLDKSLRGLLDFYERETSADGRYSIKFIDERIGRLLYPRQGKPSEMCGAANGCLTVLTDGNITGCATLAYCRKDDADIVLGNVSEGIDSRRKTSFRDSIDAIEHGECKECAFFGVCANYCVANNLVGSGTMTKIPRSICETEKVIDHRFAEIIERWKRERPQFLLSRFGNNVGRSQHTA